MIFLRNFLIKTVVIAKMLFKSPNMFLFWSWLSQTSAAATTTTTKKSLKAKGKQKTSACACVRVVAFNVEQHFCIDPKFDGVRTYSSNRLALGKTRILTLEIPFGCWFLVFAGYAYLRIDRHVWELFRLKINIRLGLSFWPGMYAICIHSQMVIMPMEIL